MFGPLTIWVATASPYYAFEKSDSVGKVIVIMLFLGSIFTWTIMLEKGIALFKAKQASERFGRLFRDKKLLLSIFRDAGKSISPVARVYESGADRLLGFLGISSGQLDLYEGTDAPKRELTAVEIETIRSSLEREVSDQILQMEDKIGLLATAVSVSPFFGLFGTVWGVMMAFCGLASQGRADIAALAPGVSGALLTTVVGLLVAIPSLIGYNLLTITIRKITVYMDNFVEEFMARVKLDQSDEH